MGRRFQAKESTVTNQLVNLMRKMNCNNLKVNKDLLGDSTEVEIIFDRNNKRYVYRVDKWEDVRDNYRAAQLTIDYLYRAYELYGAFDENEQQIMFDKFFIGLEATPDDSVLMIGNESDWWEILGVEKTALKHEIISAFKSLSKIHHPDMGGDKNTFLKLRQAYEEAIERK